MPGAHDLAAAAKKGPPKNRIAGLMCHDTVANWLVEAQVIHGPTFQQKYSHFMGSPSMGFYDKIFAQESDPQVTEGNASQEFGPEGRIVSFWTNQKLMHTMVTIGGGKLAGSNNGGVGGKLDYDQLSIEFKNGLTVHGGYKAHVLKVEDFLARYAKVMA